RMLEKAQTDIARGILSGNMLAYASPASAKMADIVIASFEGVEPDTMKGVRLVFIGKPAAGGRVRAAVDPAGGTCVSVATSKSPSSPPGRRAAGARACRTPPRNVAEDRRNLHQLRCLRARLPEPGDQPGRLRLRDRPGALHRVRRPFRRAAVRGRLPGRVHRSRSRPS